MPRSLRTVAVTAACVVLLGGCSGFEIPGLGNVLSKMNIKMPDVDVTSVKLADSPTAKGLASYYCAQYVGPFICRVLGPTTTLDDIKFNFDVQLGFANPNAIPLPVVSALFGFTAFPGSGSDQNLGDLCMTFCEDPNNCEQSADACQSNDPQIRDAKDAVAAAGNLLFNAATGATKLRDLKIKTVPSNGELPVVVRLGLNPEKMVGLIRTLAKGEIDKVKRAQVPEFNIPYSLDGAAWISVPQVGRLATNFGPTKGSWALQR